MNAVTIQQFDLLIGGKIHPATEERYFDSINPSNGQVFAQVADATIEDIQAGIAAARGAFDQGLWPGMSPAERGIYLKKIAQAIRKHAKELAQLEALDTGKTIKHTNLIDVPTCADTFEYFSDVGENLKTIVNQVSAPVESLSEREPYGVVGSIIPWNYPLIMTAWKVAPALMAGNTIVFKPSPMSCVAIMRLAQIIQELGIPQGVINVVPSRDDQVAQELVQNKDVDMVSFTGGTTTGQAVMRSASEQTKKITLELGGKSPNIVFADCDFNAAIGGTLSSIFINQGQMCTAGSRLLLEDKIYDQFLSKLIEETKKLKIGDALSYETAFGPLNNHKHRDKVLKAIEAGVREGAKVVCGGKIPSEEGLKGGCYIEPTILVDLENGMSVVQKEIFGPVLCVLKFSDIEQMLQTANDSPYGLAASIWTKDLTKAKTVAKSLKCGTVWINTYGTFLNEVSFGGYKQSGFGRELGQEGLLEYTQSKHICIDKTPGGMPLVSGWF